MLLSLFFCNAGAGPRLWLAMLPGSNCWPTRVVGSLLNPAAFTDVIGRAPSCGAPCCIIIAVPTRMPVPGAMPVPGITGAPMAVGGAMPPGMRMAVPGGIMPVAPI